MSYQAKLKRYTLILEQLNRSHYPSVSELIATISEQGLKLSERQLKRDIESLRYEFGLEIHYSALHRGYFLETSQTAFPYFLKLLEFSQNAELLTAYLKKGLDISEILDFEDFHSFKGTGFMQNLALSIMNCKEIRLVYKRFDSETEKEYLFNPYLLREYLNRWYLIGFLADNNEIRTFGLDRIVNFSSTGKTFKNTEKQKITVLFKNVIGIHASFDNKPEQIKLSCHPYLGNLLKSLPLHPSQKIESETAEETIVSLTVVINYEFTQRLLMMADQSHVISPPRLKDEMVKIIAEAQKNYQL
jgi:predicted DNA-binding transcriptional regulator YafY